MEEKYNCLGTHFFKHHREELKYNQEWTSCINLFILQDTSGIVYMEDLQYVKIMEN